MKVYFNITAPTDETSGGGPVANIIVGAVVSIAVILVLVLIVMILIWYFKRRSKKRGSIDFYHRPASSTSKDYWFEVEENVVSIIVVFIK